MADYDDQLAQLLITRGLLTDSQIREARSAQDVVRDMGIKKRLDEILVDKKWLDRNIADALLKAMQEGRDPSLADPDASIPLETSSSGVPARTPTIAGYEMVEQIGQGAMGEVYKARDLKLDRMVAIKILQANRATDARSIKRFQREARATAKLNHPNVVRGLEVGEIEGYHYFVMEYVEGQTLLDLLREHGPMDEAVALQYLHDACLALAHAHKQGIVHRDVKPSNIMVDKDGRIKVADLGLMRAMEDSGGSMLTLPGRVLGTPNYMSPEQATNSSETDARSDIFSLGASFYHLLTGRPPFHARRVVAILENVLSANPTDPRELRDDLSENTAKLLLRMLAKKPEDRPASCLSIASEIATQQKQSLIKPSPRSPVPKARVVQQVWPYSPPSSLSVPPPEDGEVDPSRLQVLPTPTEIRAALEQRRRAALDAEAKGPAPRPVQRAAPGQSTNRLRWLLLGVLAGLIIGVLLTAAVRPWEFDWERLGAPQVDVFWGRK